MCQPVKKTDCDLSCRNILTNQDGETFISLANPENKDQVTDPLYAVALLSRINTKLKNLTDERATSCIICSDLR
jgi:hypothetical protein